MSIEIRSLIAALLFISVLHETRPALHVLTTNVQLGKSF